ncbi:MAG TPA: PRC-barrel domain-containing protein [Ktedonobacterales bacterium]
MIEQLRIGAHVYSATGRQVGTLSRIVVMGQDLTVTHLVVDPGTHLGELLEPGSLDKPRDRLVPVALAREVNEEGIYLTVDAKGIAALPLFERHQYVDAPVEPGSSRFRVGDLVNYLASVFGLGAAPYQPENEEITFNIDPGSLVIPEDAPVWRNTPHEEIGVVERTLVDTATQHVTGLVVRLRSNNDQLAVAPISVVTSFEDGVAHVELTDEQLDSLAPYTGDAEETGDQD